MQPKAHYSSLYRGDTHLFKVDLSSRGTPLDLAGTVFVMEVKASDGSVLQPQLSVEGRTLLVLFPATMTASIEWSRADYDLRAVSGDVVRTYLRGSVSISPSVSRVKLGQGGGQIRTEAVAVDVGSQAIIIQRHETMPGVPANEGRLAALEAAVAAAEESGDINILLAKLQEVRAEAEEMAGRLAGLEKLQNGLNAQAETLSASLADLRGQLAEVSSQAEAAEESSEIADLAERLKTATESTAALETRLGQVAAAAAAAEESGEIAEIRQSLQTQQQRLEQLAEGLAIDTDSDAGSRKSETIHLSKDKWVQNGYPFTNEIRFKNNYKNPIVSCTVHSRTLSTAPINVGIGPVTATGCRVRLQGGLTYDNIDVTARVYLLVQEGD